MVGRWDPDHHTKQNINVLMTSLMTTIIHITSCIGLIMADSIASLKRKAKPLPEGYICKACGKGGHPIYECDIYIEKKKKQRMEKKVSPLQKFFVSGLPHSHTADEFESFLKANGITSDNIKIRLAMRSNDTESKGYGIVTLDASNTKVMLALDETTVGHRQINVKLDDPGAQMAKKSKRAMTQESASSSRCFRCGEHHLSKDCTNPRICYRCKSTDHISSDCPKKLQK